MKIRKLLCLSALMILPISMSAGKANHAHAEVKKPMTQDSLFNTIKSAYDNETTVTECTDVYVIDSPELRSKIILKEPQESDQEKQKKYREFEIKFGDKVYNKVSEKGAKGMVVIGTVVYRNNTNLVTLTQSYGATLKDGKHAGCPNQENIQYFESAVREVTGMKDPFENAKKQVLSK